MSDMRLDMEMMPPASAEIMGRCRGSRRCSVASRQIFLASFASFARQSFFCSGQFYFPRELKIHLPNFHCRASVHTLVFRNSKKDFGIL